MDAKKVADVASRTTLNSDHQAPFISGANWAEKQVFLALTEVLNELQSVDSIEILESLKRKLNP